MALRPYWSGNLKMSLVSFPVEVYPALNRSKQIPLHEIYRPTKQRVHRLSVVDDEPVDKSEIVKGYEVEKGEYVILEPKEIKDLKIPSKETLEIVEFVSTDAIDDVYFEMPYFVSPKGKAGEDAFVIIRDSLREMGKIGLGQLAIGGRERLCAIKPYGVGMLLETLRYEDEIKKSDPFFQDIEKHGGDKEQMALAKELIKRKSTTFKPSKFHDHYREALQELIDSKIEHRKPVEISDEKPSGKVINLMDALRKSLSDKGGRSTGSSKPSAKSKEKPKAKAKSGRKKAG